MDLSIIIVSWNVSELLARLIDSILQFTEELQYEIIVIDNDSRDSTAKLLKEQYQQQITGKQIVIIANDFNAGFAKANNQGLKIARGKYVVFMNPDMELVENSFLKLKQLIEQMPDAGIATCRLLYAYKTVQPNVKGNPTFFSQLLILLKLHHFLRSLPSLKKYFQIDFDYSRKQYVEQVMGALIFMKKEIADKIGGWDENYWLWWEDIELCKNIKERGLEIVYLPITEIIHYEGKSFSQTSGWSKQKRFNRGMLTYFKKRRNYIAYYILLALQPVSYILTVLTKIFRVKPRSQSFIDKK